MNAAYVMWDRANRRHYAARTRPIAARARRRHNRRRWVLDLDRARCFMRCAMTDIDCPGPRARYSNA